MRRKYNNSGSTNRVGRLLEAAFWIIGLLCVSAYGVSKTRSAIAQSAAIATLEAEWNENLHVEPDQSRWSRQRIARHEQSRSNADDMQALALLEIPAADIRVAVFEGTADHTLDLGVGRVPGTARVGSPGNLALAGHRDGFFRGLKDIEVGDDVSIRHRSGITRYVVTELSIVEPDNVSVLAPTEGAALTLVTCYPFYFVGNAPKRFIVRAVSKADEIEK